MNPLVSINALFLNTEKYVLICIESTVNQTYENLELIMIMVLMITAIYSRVQ